MIKIRDGLAVNPEHVISLYIRADNRSLDQLYDLRIKLTNGDHWVKQKISQDEAIEEMGRILGLL